MKKIHLPNTAQGSQCNQRIIDDDYYYSVDEITEDIFEDAFSQFKYDFDNIYGGLGTHPSSYAHNLYFF